MYDCTFARQSAGKPVRRKFWPSTNHKIILNWALLYSVVILVDAQNFHHTSFPSCRRKVKLEVPVLIWSNYWTFLVENAQNVEDGNGKRKSSLRKRFFGNFQRLSETQTEAGEDDHSSINEENSIEPKILSDEELLHKYWKLVVSSLLITKDTGRLKPYFFATKI